MKAIGELFYVKQLNKNEHFPFLIFNHKGKTKIALTIQTTRRVSQPFLYSFAEFHSKGWPLAAHPSEQTQTSPHKYMCNLS